MTTISQQLREQGNAIYKNISPNLAPVLRIKRFEEALNFYNRALNSAESDLDKSCASKNIMVVSGSVIA